MTISELGAVGEFFGSILTLVTLVYLAIQIRQNTAQQKREELVSIQHGQNGVIAGMQDPGMMEAFVRAAGERNPSIEDLTRAQNWILQYLNHFQIIHDLYTTGALDEERYQLGLGLYLAALILLFALPKFTFGGFALSVLIMPIGAVMGFCSVFCLCRALVPPPPDEDGP